MIAMDTLAMSIKNDTLQILHNHKILPEIGTAMDKLGKKLGEIHRQLETENLNNI